MANLGQLTGLQLKFSPNPRWPSMHKHLNDTYGVMIELNDEFYRDGTRAAFRDDVYNHLLEVIVEEAIRPQATETDSVASIRQVLVRATILLGYGANRGNGGGFKVRLHHRSLSVHGLAEVTAGRFTMDVIIGTSRIYPNDPEPTYLDWAVFETDPTGVRPLDAPAPQNAPQPALTAELIQTAVTAGVQGMQIDGQAISDAVVQGVRNVRIDATVQPVQIMNLAQYTFDTRALPNDVRDLYTRRCDHRMVIRRHIQQPFGALAGMAHGLRYYFDGDRLILKDGSLFVPVATPDEKTLKKDPLLCTDDSHVGIRAWYEAFRTFAADRGYFVFPFWCFRKDHGGDSGFTFGGDENDDLPVQLRVAVQGMTQPIWRVLSRSDMFPKESKFHTIVRENYGDGHKALKQIARGSHPEFFEHPATLIPTYPKQGKNQSLRAYYRTFMDYLQLRAIIHDNPSDFAMDSEKDMFTSQALHSEWLWRCSREERRRPDLQHKFTTEQIVETFEGYLNLPDSPVVIAKKKSEQTEKAVKLASPESRPRNTATRRPTKLLKPTPRYSKTAAKLSAIRTSGDGEATTEQLLEEAVGLEVPNGLEERRLHAVYCTVINAIQATEDERLCIVCGGKHRFDGCEVLKNTDFLKSHYIRYCQQLRREASSREATFSDGAGTVPGVKSSAVRFIDADEPASSKETEETDDDAESDDGMDFFHGRR